MVVVVLVLEVEWSVVVVGVVVVVVGVVGAVGVVVEVVLVLVLVEVIVFLVLIIVFVVVSMVVVVVVVVEVVIVAGTALTPRAPRSPPLYAGRAAPADIQCARPCRAMASARRLALAALERASAALASDVHCLIIRLLLLAPALARLPARPCFRRMVSEGASEHSGGECCRRGWRQMVLPMLPR